jgi:hypothetical protein
MSSILKEGKANTHLTHLEELVLTRGEEGYEMARSFLLEMIKVLRGDGDTKVSTSVKWDGAPAIFAGINPDNGKFFVGTKSIFNKDPKINYTLEDIKQNHGHAPGLVDKLNKALYYLPSLGIKKILQGDFMFDDGMLEVIDIDGEPHYRFKPNTIIYAVPVNSKLGQQIGNAKFGIVFHTTYNDLKSGASFGADVSRLKRRSDVWFDDAFFKNDTGTVTLTDDDEERVITLVKQADAVNRNINYEDIPLAKMNIYLNSEIRGGVFADDAQGSYQGFVEWNQNRLTKRINKLKSEKGKQRAMATGTAELEAIERSKDNILNVFRLSRLLFEAKNVFIEKYNNAVYATKHFVDDGSGDLKVTNPEGYVAVDFAGNGVKFVDRLEFSRANFMMDKGFKKTDIKENQMLEIFWNNKKSTKMSLREWHTLLPKTNKTNKKLFEDLKAYKMVTALIPDSKMVKLALAEAIQWAIDEQKEEQSNIDTVLMVYPGRFQPMGKHHAAVYKELSKTFGEDKTFIVTSNKVKLPKSPLDFSEKLQIINRHGIENAVQVKNPYKAEELTSQYDPDKTALLFAVGKKDMMESPRFRVGKKKNGEPSYFQYYDANKNNLQPLSKHGYLYVAPHVSLEVPGFGEMSGTTLRKALADADEETFKNIMGWFDQDIYNLLKDKFSNLSEMSSAGAVAGYSVPLGSTEDEDSNMVNEVLDYLFKQGILK